MCDLWKKWYRLERRRKKKQARKAEKMVIPAGFAQSAVPADGVACALRRQIRSRTLALVCDTRTMRFHANHVSSSISGDYYQAMFEAEEDTNDPDSPYFLIQRQFETSDDGRCYIETHDEKYIGHFLLRRVEFTPERLSIEFDRPSDNLVSVTFSMAVSDFEEASQVIKIISGEVDFNDKAPSVYNLFLFRRLVFEHRYRKCVGTRRRVQCMVQKRRNRNLRLSGFGITTSCYRKTFWVASLIALAASNFAICSRVNFQPTEWRFCRSCSSLRAPTITLATVGRCRSQFSAICGTVLPVSAATSSIASMIA